MRIFMGCLLVLLSTGALADTSDTGNNQDYRVWIDLGILGSTQGEDTRGMGSLTALKWEQDGRLFTLRYSDYTDGASLGDCIVDAIFGGSCDDDAIQIEAWGLLYGRTFADGHWSVSGGIGSVKGRNAADSGQNFDTMGIPLALEWREASGPHFGTGISLIANLNDKQSFVGAYLSIQLGRLR